MNTSASATEAPLTRRMWRTLEPYHGFVYFSKEATECYAALGAPDAMHYFASRSAAMGAASPAVVEATFFNFAPHRVHAALPAAWDVASPAQWCQARLNGVDQTLRRVIGDAIDSTDMQRAADLARRAASAVDGLTSGRPLAAAQAGLPWPDAPHLVLWQAIAVLREFRGDGHIALLVDAGLSGIEALVTHGASGDVPPPLLQSTRGWTDAEWSAAVERLRARGIVDSGGSFTAEGRALRDRIEAGTDRLAAAPWDALGEDLGGELRQLVRPWSKAIVAARAIGFNNQSSRPQ